MYGNNRRLGLAPRRTKKDKEIENAQHKSEENTDEANAKIKSEINDAKWGIIKKNYCVHVYPAMIDYENIKAKSPEEAEDKVLRAEWPMYDQVDHVEVMRQCSCGQDNDLENKKCESCGKKL